MKYLVEFVERGEVEQSTIFAQLKCGVEEAKILQAMARRYITGQEDSGVLELLQELFGEEDYGFLAHLDQIKNLLELGWIAQQSFTPLKVSEACNLELLNTSVALSTPFLRLLELGSLEMTLPEIKPYEDHLEYLQDQFFRIELYQKISTVRHQGNEQSLSIHRLQNKLEILEKRIGERIAQTTSEIALEKYIRTSELEGKEEVIFLALLKEEYSAGDNSLREMTALIDLISSDEYDRIRNRSLLEEGSKLLTEEIIDYEEMLNPFGGIARAFYIVDEVLQNIMHPQKKKKVHKLKLDMLIKEQEIFELVDPTTSLDDVVLNPSTRRVLDNLMHQMDKRVVQRLVEWGVKSKKQGVDARIIFYGPPGTGKTMTAYSLSKSLKRQVLSFDCSKILSMYVGESEKNVRKIFDTYKELTEKTKTEPVLLLNEADQFLSARSSGTGSSAEQMHNQMQNIFLEQIEGFKGILIATTNLLENIDSAFSRRFNYKIEFKRPDREQRRILWEKMLPVKAPYAPDFDIAKLAGYDLSGGQISLVIKNTAFNVATMEEPLFTLEAFVEEIEKEKRGTFDTEKAMGFLQG
ncbi:ATP-binding protein [Sulfurimonas sp. HSL1-2]|uniref:AAA family ATPase n=1 Tax=Thiomicrolovo zhangzhouensis TaxID=3131933 RepID=UPI0031F73595